MAHRAASTAPAAALAFLLLLTRAAEAEPQPATGPAIIARTASGQVAVRAVRVAAALKIDGRLDESPYTTIQPISDFVQQEPREGEPATEKTDAWIFFDDTSLYIAARC